MNNPTQTPQGPRRPKVVAVIMTYNCARLLRKAYEQLPMDCIDEVIVTDDGSRDNIEQEAANLGLTLKRHTPNRGYGGNLKAGLTHALERGADYIVEIHGDGQFHPSALRHAMPFIREGREFIIGSRFIHPRRALELKMPLIRFLANRGLSFIDRIVLGLPFTEFHTGFRIYSREFLNAVPWRDNSNDYLFSFQIIAQAAYARARVAEVPVEADYRGDHTSHSIKGASIYAFQTFRVLADYILARLGISFTPVFPARDRMAARAVTECQGCGNRSLKAMFDLGVVPSVNTYFTKEELHREYPYLLDVHWCTHCTLVQLGTIVPPGELFSHYQHLSSASQSNIRHLEELAATLKQKLSIGASTRVMDVGSNDGTLLSKFLDRTPHVLGVDPAENLVTYAKERGVEQIAAFLNPETAKTIVASHGRRDLIMALNVVAHTPDVRNLLRAVNTVLAEKGTFVMEAVHVFATILKGEFDTVYHEHVYCFSLTALVPLLAQAGLTVVDVEEIPTQGGSLRVYARHTSEQPGIADVVHRLLEREEKEGVRDPETYARVGRQVEAFKRDFRQSLQVLRAKHGRIVALGAPARGVVIMNACGISTDIVDAVVDDTPLKQGRLMPGVHIPVISWKELAANPASGYVLLSWNYEEEMLSKLRGCVREADVVIPFPTLRTVRL
ncbi:MAG: C-methyltransferase [Candidatus Peregrinibacteria bacterium Gr01-1014_25]|nr:MAG: C-methyltransferase [Candidatus Peregrinibacteria bacterium Gr01-1014_25]